MTHSKTCSKCQSLQSVNNFYKFSRSKDGYSVWCKACSKSYHKTWRDLNPDKLKALRQAYKLLNPDNQKDYYKKNKTKIDQINKEWSINNPEKKKLMDKAWAVNNPEKVKANATKFRLLNPEKQSQARQKRRAWLRSCQSYKVTSKEIAKMLNSTCAYCKEKSNHLDHVIPLSRGGSNGIGNLVGSCARCNMSKNNKTIMEWRLWKMKL